MHRRYLVTTSILALMHTPSRATERPLIAAATSLQPALEEAGPLIATQTGIMPRFAYGASGNLARQIAQGAPFELLLAADEASILTLAKAGHLRDEGHVYARGRFALVPEALHELLRHRLALTRRASEAALRLQAWFLSPIAAQVFARHGLEAP